MAKNSFLKTALAGLAAIAAAGAWARSEWTWGVPSSVYKDLDFNLRAGVDRAVKIFKIAEDAERSGKPVRDLVPLYRGAAAEWRKVQIMSESEEFSEPLLAAVVFMQGYSYDRARDRNEAIKTYNEVLDLYPDEIESAVAAKWHIARVKLGMGDTRAGNAIIDEMVEDERPLAMKHPLMAEAYMNKAGRLFNACEEDEAGDYWNKVIKTREFHKNAWQEVQSAKNMFRFLCFVSGDFQRLEEMLFDGIDEKATSKMANAIIGQFNWAMGEYGNRGSGTWSYFMRKEKGKEKAAAEKMKKFFSSYLSWGQSKSPIFLACNRKFDFDMMLFKAWYMIETKEQIKARFDKLIAEVQKDSDKKRVLARLKVIAEALMNLGDFATARIVATMIPDQKERLLYCYGIESRQRRWKEMLDLLEQLLALKGLSADEVTGFKWQKVDCLENLGKFEDEIKLLNDIADPPRTLWRLSRVYRRVGNKSKSYAMLNEIMFFPKDAPASVLTQARYREEDGEKDTAIALYRRLLSQPEWKQCGESSAAHQALERLGIATGGAMTNTLR